MITLSEFLYDLEFEYKKINNKTMFIQTCFLDEVI